MSIQSQSCQDNIKILNQFQKPNNQLALKIQRIKNEIIFLDNSLGLFHNPLIGDKEKYIGTFKSA